MNDTGFVICGLIALGLSQLTGCSGLEAFRKPPPSAVSGAPSSSRLARAGGVAPLSPLSSERVTQSAPRRLPRANEDLQAVRLASLEDPLSSSAQPHVETEVDDQPAPARLALRRRTVDEALNPIDNLAPLPIQPVTQQLDLTSALAIAGGQSPQIAFAAARYQEAYAQLAAARTLWLPSLRVGASFNHHDGPLQASPGDVLDTSRSSLQAGMGASAVGAGSPMTPGVLANFHAADAIFQPKIAANVTCARSAAAEAATNDTLLATALAYLELLRATQLLRIAEQTRDDADQLAELTATFASTGQGPQADADRAETELVRRRNDVSRAGEAVAVAGARLAEQLSLDASVPIQPMEDAVVAIDLVAPDMAMVDLVAAGLTARPELAEAQHLVCEAVQRYQRERFSPLVPSVLLGISQSGYGGGRGSRINEFSGRFDLDATVYWELRNLGLGECAKRREMAARRDQAQALQVRMMDRVAREVVEAGTQVQSRKSQIEVAEGGIQAATNSYERNLARIREGQGLPIEALQSLQALDEARREYLRTVADYNEAQFRLQRALGWPIQ